MLAMEEERTGRENYKSDVGEGEERRAVVGLMVHRRWRDGRGAEGGGEKRAGERRDAPSLYVDGRRAALIGRSGRWRVERPTRQSRLVGHGLGRSAGGRRAEGAVHPRKRPIRRPALTPAILSDRCRRASTVSERDETHSGVGACSEFAGLDSVWVGGMGMGRVRVRLRLRNAGWRRDRDRNRGGAAGKLQAPSSCRKGGEACQTHDGVEHRTTQCSGSVRTEHRHRWSAVRKRA